MLRSLGGIPLPRPRRVSVNRLAPFTDAELDEIRRAIQCAPPSKTAARLHEEIEAERRLRFLASSRL